MTPYTERPEWQAHVAGIIADPADDLRREVLADWLEEIAGYLPCKRCHDAREVGWSYLNSGVRVPHPCPECTHAGHQPASDGARERAEFIRVQLHLAKVAAHYHNGNRECDLCREFDLWTKREQELFKAGGYGDKPGGLLARIDIDYFGHLDTHQLAIFRRGFVAHVRCRLAVWEGGGAEWVKAFPVETVAMTDRQPHHVESGADDRPRYTWHRGRRTSRLEDLPDGVFYQIPEQNRTGNYSFHGSRDEADVAASAALIAWARAAT